MEVTVKAESLGEMLLKINRMNAKPGTVFIPDLETAEKIGTKMMHDISVALEELREQQRKQTEASRLTFIDMHTPFGL